MEIEPLDDEDLAVLADCLEACRAFVDAGLPVDGLAAMFGDLAPHLRQRVMEELARLRPSGAVVSDTPSCPSTPGLSGRTLPVVPGFEILHQLGRGGMGVVYKALQPSVDRYVALKMIVTGAFASTADVARFQNEARAIARLQHPGIVPFHEVGEHEGRPFYTMALLEGGSLEERASNFAEPTKAAVLVATLARAISYAHQRGILHRDLKPRNVLFDGEGRPYITDFGLAKLLGSEAQLTQGSVALGTPEYMAPEQAEGHGVTIAADIYALGAILYRLLVGRPPFSGPTALATLEAVRQGDPIPPRRLCPRLDRDLDTICLTCLAKEPTKRYPSAEALVVDLDHWQRDEPIVARPVHGVERVRKFCRRHTLGVTVGALLLVFLVVSVTSTIGFLVWEAGREKARAETAQAALAEAGVNDYFYRIALAHSEYWNDSVGAAKDQLMGCPEPLRSWEWHFLRKLCYGELRNPSLPKGPFEIHDATPDGSQVCYLLQSGDLVVSSTLTGEHATVCPVVRPQVSALSWDGKLVASSGGDAILRVFEVRNGQQIYCSPRQDKLIYLLAFSPDGRCVASASRDETVRLWDVLAGQPMRFPLRHKTGVNCLAFSPDSRLLATGTRGTPERDKGGEVAVWEVKTGKGVSTYSGHSGTLRCLAWNRDGRIASGTQLLDNRQARTGELHTWEPAGSHGRGIHLLAGHPDSILGASFSPDGQRLVSSGADRTVRVWDLSDGKELTVIRGTTAFFGARFLPNGSEIVTWDSEGQVQIWDAVRGQGPIKLVYPVAEGAPFALAYHPDGKGLAVGLGNGGIRLWDLKNRQSRLPFLAHPGETNKGIVTALAFSPDGKILASAGRDGHVKVWDLEPGDPPVLKWSKRVSTEYVNALAVSPDGAGLLAGTSESTLCLLDITTGVMQATLRGCTDQVRAVAFSPDGRLMASGGEEAIARIWDTATGQELLVLRGHTNTVSCVAFSPDARWLVTGSYDGTLRIWDVATGEVLVTCSGHSRPVLAVSIHPDGQRLASASIDRTVRLWESRTGRLILTLKGHTGAPSAVAFSPDGNSLASAGWDRTIRIWDGTQHNAEGPNPP